MPPAKKRVLFICLGNACRSPMAEAIARVDAGDVMEVSSAGLYPLGEIPRHTQTTLENNGYSCEGLFSKRIESEAWERADVVINLSGRERHRQFADYEKVEDWVVGDPYGLDAAIYQEIFQNIQARVRQLAQRLRSEQELAVESRK